MRPLERYQAELDSGRLEPDPSQRDLVERLDRLASALEGLKPWQPPRRRLFGLFASHGATTQPGPQGVYVFGGVGRGKTRLCDLFYESIEPRIAQRLHFHSFMKRIHEALRERASMNDPLPDVAAAWASRMRLLLLDEMHVNDITDAMLLGRLLQGLFDRGVTLVTTSNVAPDGLYRDGLQRANFLPAIAAIKSHCEVIEMLGATDYRLRALKKDAIYNVGAFVDGQADAATEQHLTGHFRRLTGADEASEGNIEVNGRDIRVLGEQGDVVWFSFEALCRSARSTEDYIEIADRYSTVLLSHLPVLDNSDNDAARRFVNLVDEFYDRGVKLIISAEADATAIYQGTRLAFEFERATSRLIEMQGEAYLARQHLEEA